MGRKKEERPGLKLSEKKVWLWCRQDELSDAEFESWLNSLSKRELLFFMKLDALVESEIQEEKALQEKQIAALKQTYILRRGKRIPEC